MCHFCQRKWQIHIIKIATESGWISPLIDIGEISKAYGDQMGSRRYSCTKFEIQCGGKMTPFGETQCIFALNGSIPMLSIVN